jgi:nuclear-control-of-ATPase protein 2
MAVALGKEKLGFTQRQLDALHEQVERGDLTAVLQIYEEDIKSPIRSAVAGTLVRSLLIQVQKMKVNLVLAILSNSLKTYHRLT